MRENIEVEVRPHPEDGSKHQAVVRDQVAKRAWSGEGTTPSEATTEAVRKFIGDRNAREYVQK